LCIICSDAWKVSGPHRVVALRCGHIYGKRCIEKWVADKGKCPFCSAPTTIKDLIPLYLNASVNKKVLQKHKQQNDEIVQNIRKELRSERKKRRTFEGGIASLKTKINDYLNSDANGVIELDIQPPKKKRKLVNAEEFIQSLSDDINKIGTEQMEQSSQLGNTTISKYAHQYKISRELLTHDTATFFDFLNDPTIIILDNKKTGDLTKFNITEDKLESIPIQREKTYGQQPLITDLKSFNNGLSTTSLVYVTSSDQRARVLDIRTQNPIIDITLPAIASCCQFDEKVAHLMYCGTVNGFVHVFDIRMSTNALVNSISLMNGVSVNNTISAMCTPSRGKLIVSHTQSGVHYLDDPTSKEGVVKILSLPTKEDVAYPYSVCYDPIEDVCSASFASVREVTRNIDHFVSRLFLY
jgi:E3 ubiquitin-protein ligase RFWD3